MGRPQKDTGNWLVTYSDLMTLLLVFFVLLYILTPGVDVSSFDSFLSFFQKSTGIIDETSVVDDNSNRSQIMEEWQAMEDFLEREDISSQVEITQTPDGVKITLSSLLTFNSGSSELLPAAKGVLDEIVGFFNDRIAEAEVQGHTDNVPISSNSYYKTNWHLGASRAVSVVQYIRERSDLDPKRFKASSYGEFLPVATNVTAEGRSRNRRVEIYVRYKDMKNTAPILELEPEGADQQDI